MTISKPVKVCGFLDCTNEVTEADEVTVVMDGVEIRTRVCQTCLTTRLAPEPVVEGDDDPLIGADHCVS